MTSDRVTPRYPHITVDLGDLNGQDGNAFAIINRVRKAMQAADVPQPMISRFYKQATAGDYQRLLAVVPQWVNAPALPWDGD